MLNTLWGVVKKEKIELLEKANIPEGTKVLVTVLPDDTDSQFWLKTSQISAEFCGLGRVPACLTRIPS